jgi:CheY-like chemotaxis protein
MPKLMLVEDDNNLREIYEARLQAEGYQIISARDGEEALVLAKSERPDLIIADVMMPKISGFEMLDILRNTDGLKEVKVIMLTALGQSDDQQRATRLGADRYLVKSQVTLEDIVKVSHELLGDRPAAAPAAVPPPTAPPLEPEPVAEPPAVAKSPVEPSVTPPPATTIPVTMEAPSAPFASPLPVTTDDNPVNEAPVPATPPTDPVASQTAADDAQPAIQEEADVESKVENFVAGATEEPTPPAGAPAPDSTTAEPSEPNPPADTPVVAAPVVAEPEPDTSAAAVDDKLMADAAEALVNSTEKVATGTPALESTSTVSAAPADTPQPSSDGRSKRIIKPLDTKPKQDITTLLALEEAKEATSKTPPPPKPVIAVDNPKAPHALVPPNPVIEPPAADPDDIPSGSTSGAPAPPVEPNNPADPESIAL